MDDYLNIGEFSAQTRQTKTALILSGSALFLFAAVGDVSTIIKIPPGYFEIPSEAVFPLLFVSTLYFLVSYYISYQFDTKKESLEIASLNNLKDRIRSFNELNGQNAALRSAINKYDKIIVDDISAGIRSIDHGTIWHRVREECEEEIQILLRPVQEFVNSFEKHDWAKIRVNDKESISQADSAAKSFKDELTNELKQLETALTGVSRRKNYWLDFVFPVFGVGGAALLFAAARVSIFLFSGENVSLWCFLGKLLSSS